MPAQAQYNRRATALSVQLQLEVHVELQLDSEVEVLSALSASLGVQEGGEAVSVAAIPVYGS